MSTCYCIGNCTHTLDGVIRDHTLINFAWFLCYRLMALIELWFYRLLRKKGRGWRKGLLVRKLDFLLTHSLTHSLTHHIHSLTHSLTHFLIYSFAHLLTYSPNYPLTHPPISLTPLTSPHSLSIRYAVFNEDGTLAELKVSYMHDLIHWLS